MYNIFNYIYSCGKASVNSDAPICFTASLPRKGIKMKVRNFLKKHLILSISVMFVIAVFMSVATLTVMAGASPSGEVLKSYQISMSGQLNLRFIYSDLGNAVSFKAEVYAPGAKSPKSIYTYPVSEIKDNMTVSVPLAPSEMTYTVRVYPVSADGTAGTVRECSAVEYARRVMAATDEHDDTMRAMLNWGAYAQKYFDAALLGSVSEFASDGLFARGTDPVSAVTSVPYETHEKLSCGTGFSDGVVSLALERNNIALHFYVDYNGDYPNDLKATIQRDGLNGNKPLNIGVSYNGTTGKCCISVDRINVGLFDELYTLTLTDGRSSFTAKTSVLEYLNYMITDSTGAYKESQKDTARSLYQFCFLATGARDAEGFSCAHGGATNNVNTDHYWIAKDGSSSYYKCSHCFARLGEAVNNNVEKYMPAELLRVSGSVNGSITRTLMNEGGTEFVRLNAFKVNSERYFSLRAFTNGQSVSGNYIVMKVRMSGGEQLGIFARTGDNAVVTESLAEVKVANDGAWHTIVVDMAARTDLCQAENGKYRLSFLDIRPIYGAQENVSSSAYLDIAYIAMCDDINDAFDYIVEENYYEYSTSKDSSLNYTRPNTSCDHSSGITSSTASVGSGTQYTYSCSSCGGALYSRTVPESVGYFDDAFEMGTFFKTYGNATCNGERPSQKVDALNGIAYTYMCNEQLLWCRSTDEFTNSSQGGRTMNVGDARYLVIRAMTSASNRTFSLSYSTAGKKGMKHVKFLMDGADGEWVTYVIDLETLLDGYHVKTDGAEDYIVDTFYLTWSSSYASTGYTGIEYIAFSDDWSGVATIVNDDTVEIIADNTTGQHYTLDAKSGVCVGEHPIVITSSTDASNNTVYNAKCTACGIETSHTVASNINYYSDLSSMKVFGGNKGTISGIRIEDGVAYRTYSSMTGEHFNITGGTGPGTATKTSYKIGDYLVIKYRRDANASVNGQNTIMVGSEGRDEGTKTNRITLTGVANDKLSTEWTVAVLDISSMKYWLDSNNNPKAAPFYLMMNPGGALTIDIAYVASVDSLDELKGLVTDEKFVYLGSWGSTGKEYDVNANVSGHITPAQMNNAVANKDKADKWSASTQYLLSNKAIKIENGVKYFSFSTSSGNNVAQFIWNRDTTVSNGYSAHEIYTTNAGAAKYILMKLRTSNNASSNLAIKVILSTVGNARQSFVIPLDAVKAGEWGTYAIDLESVLGEVYKKNANGEYEIDTFYLHMEPFTNGVTVDIEYMSFVEEDWKELPTLPLTGDLIKIIDREGGYSKLNIGTGKCTNGCSYSSDGSYTCRICGSAPKCKGIHEAAISETSHYRADCPYCGYEGITYGSHDAGTCTACGYKGGIACAHPDDKLTVKSSAVSGGTKYTYTCSKCGKVAYEHIEYKVCDHKYVNAGESGHYAEACSVCGAAQGSLEAHELSEHSFDNGNTLTMTYICSVCGYEAYSYSKDHEKVGMFLDKNWINTKGLSYYMLNKEGIKTDTATGAPYASYSTKGTTAQIIFARTGYNSAAETNAAFNVGNSRYFVLRMRTSNASIKYQMHFATKALSDTSTGKEPGSKITFPTSKAGNGKWATYIVDLASLIPSSYKANSDGTYTVTNFWPHIGDGNLPAGVIYDYEFMAFTKDLASAKALVGDSFYISVTGNNTGSKVNITSSGGSGGAVTQTVTPSQLITLLKNKSMTAGSVYTVSGDVTLSSDTNYYGNGAKIIGNIVLNGTSNVILKDIELDGRISVTGASDITLFNLSLNSPLSLDANSSNISLEGCRLTASGTAISSSANVLTVNGCEITAAIGIQSSGKDLAVYNTAIKATSAGIVSSGEYAIIRNNRVSVSEKAEGIKLAEGTVNSLVSQNTVTGTYNSINVDGVFNSTVIFNNAVGIFASNSKNIYVIENTSDAIVLTKNNYLICDANKAAGAKLSVINIGNDNYNGDTLQDLDARAEHGANEEILPHTNKDLFIGMEKRRNINDPSLARTYDYCSYITSLATSEDVVIVPPGAYAVDSGLLLNYSQANTKIYAYGVYQEKAVAKDAVTGNLIGADNKRVASSLGTILRLDGSNISVKGLTVGYDFQSSGQIYALEKYSEGGKYYAKVITAAGYINGFAGTDYSSFASTVSMTKGDALFPWANGVGHNMVKYEDGSYVDENGIMVIELTSKAQYDLLEVGDIFGCRLGGDNATSVGLNGKNAYLEDCVIYGYSAALAMVSGGRNAINVQLERVHNTSRPAPVIDKATYDKYKALEAEYGLTSDGSDPTSGNGLEVYIDAEGRYRGALPRYGSVDATHIIGAAQGTSATSCIFENMVDDGSNQRSSSARISGAHDNGDGTTTLYYKGSWAQTYYNIDCGDHKTSGTPTGNGMSFLAGDRMFAYASTGRTLVDGAKVLTNSQKAGTLPLDVHVAHSDDNNDCICDSCGAMMHIDNYTNGGKTVKRDCKCDRCGIVVHTDYDANSVGTGVTAGQYYTGDNRCNQCSANLKDVNGDKKDDTTGAPIVTDMATEVKYDPSSSTIEFKVYTYDRQKADGSYYIMTYKTTLSSVIVKTEDVNFDTLSGYDFTDNDYFMEQKILCDNISINSVGFTFDNVLMQNYHSRGILMKTRDSVVKNCTFRNIGSTAMLLSIEPTWGESTVPRNITIKSCLFDSTGLGYNYASNKTFAPIAIQGLGNAPEMLDGVSRETLPCKNIDIIDNKFINTNNDYCITIGQAQDITITGNIFEVKNYDSGQDLGKSIWINESMDIKVYGNTYSQNIEDEIDATEYKGLYGEDVEGKIPEADIY